MANFLNKRLMYFSFVDVEGTKNLKRIISLLAITGQFIL